MEETEEDIRQRALIAAAEKAAKEAAKSAAESASAAGASAEPAAVSVGKKKKKAPADGDEDGQYWKSYSTVVVPAAQMQEATPWLDGPERAYVIVLAMCVPCSDSCIAAHALCGAGLF